jgi:predicted dehydrogenase
MAKKYKAAILGCAGRSDFHVDAYKYVNDVEMVAACDLIDDLAEKFCTKYNLRCYKGLTSAEEMIKKEKPDLLHIVTRPELRVPLLTLASELGVPAVIVEKPIATESKDWKKLCALAKTTKTKIGVNSQFRYHPDLTRCREVLNSGKLGKILFMEATAGFNICDQGVHVLDWSSSLNGDSPVARVFGGAGGTAEIASKHPSPTDSTAQLTFANGVNAIWTLGSCRPEVKRLFEMKGLVKFGHCRVAAYAERGRILFEEFGKWEIVSPEGTEGGVRATLPELKDYNDRSQANFTNAMIDWLEDDKKIAPTNIGRALEHWNAILGLYASVVYGRPIEIPFVPADNLFDKLKERLKEMDAAAAQ